MLGRRDARITAKPPPRPTALSCPKALLKPPLSLSLPPLQSSPAPTRSNPFDCPTLLAASRKLTRRIARSHYENFLVASVLLPRSMRQPFYDVYAFCRTADDLADESPSIEAATRGLAEYRTHIAALFDGMPDNLSDSRSKRQPVADRVPSLFVALFDTVARYALPREPFDNLLDAFLQDQTVRRYPDEATLLDYCRRSADPVGRLVLAMADCDSDENLKHSDEICTALQLANFWQDVARDYAIGRIYLPASVMQQHGFDESLIDATIVGGKPTPESIRAAIASQCEQTRLRFERGRPLIENVPDWLAADIELFIGGGVATLDVIAAIDYDVLRIRPQVNKRTQAGLVGRGLLNRLFGRRVKPSVVDPSKRASAMPGGETS